ncbi:hypothetical protein [Adhaeretor mobilis]|uniref:Uncharacterized protein n=1 Tax=Adhaeretor mobilis TaxID=1930276 RepID=A0A517MTT2_9BACT|nr:hypothetical protein [Adhaeretor mobilis]QDS98294.1 hypothetical protein HG15A2_15670 [Adhaeretor mobilis]
MNTETEQSPDDAILKQDKTSTVPMLRGFRWQLIPVSFIGLVGCLSLGLGLFAGLIMAYIAMTGQPLYEPGPTRVDTQGVATMFGGVAVGLVLIYSARQWWRGHWLKSILLIVLCVGVGKGIELVTKAVNSSPQRLERKPTESNAKALIPFDVPESNLTVMLPKQPTAEHLVANTELGLVGIQLYETEETISGSSTFVCYAVSVNTYTDGFIESIASENDGDFLKGLAVGGLRKRPGSKVIARKTTMLYGLPGVAERIVMPGGRTDELRKDMPVVVHRHYYQEEDRVYSFQILTLETMYEKAPEEFNRIADEFFGSISTRVRSEVH